jgi:hypothetical protein
MNGRDQEVRFATGLLTLALAVGGCALAADVGTGDSRPSGDADRGDRADVAQEDDGADIDAPFARPETDGPVRETLVNTPVGSFNVKYKVSGEDAIAEGDMIIGSSNLQSAPVIGRRWPNKTVPFVIDADLPNSTRVLRAMAHWTEKTGFKFVPRTTEFDYVHFRSSTGCSSMIGQWGGRQFINLDTQSRAMDVVAVGIDRSASPQRIYYYYGAGPDNRGLTGGFASGGTLTRVNGVKSHFRFLMAAGKSVANLVDVAFASNGHAFAWYDDGTVSEGTHRDFSQYAAPKPYALAPNKTPADVAGFAIDANDQVHAFYKDGTASVGTITDLAAVRGPAPVKLAEGKTPDMLAHVDFGSDGRFVAFYNETTTTEGVDGGAPTTHISGMTISAGTAVDLAKAMQPGAELPKLGYGLTGHCTDGASVHEIGHAVGLYHEQTRHDRDQFVEIRFANVDPSDRHNFEKHSLSSGFDHGEYDFSSIMHYGPDSFTLRPKSECGSWNPANAETCAGTWTIVPKVDSARFDGGTFEEQRRTLSEGDIAAINTMYPQPPTP